MATAPMLLVVASALAFSAVIASGGEPKSSENGQNTTAELPMKDYNPELPDYNPELPFSGYKPGQFPPATEDPTEEAYAPGDPFMEAIAKAMAPSPDDDKDYDPVEVVSELMKSDIELAKERPDLIPASAPEIDRAETLANDQNKLGNQIAKDMPDVVNTLDKIAPGAARAISLPPMRMMVPKNNMTSGEENAATVAVVSVHSIPLLLGLLAFFY